MSRLLGGTPPPAVRYPATDNPGDANTTFSTSAHTSEVSKIRQLALSDIVDPTMVYGNFGYGEVDGPNNLTLSASIEYPPSTINVAEWDSGASQLITPGSIQSCVIEGLTIPEGAFHHPLTGTIVAPGGTYYQPHSTNDGYGEGVDRDVGVGKVTAGGVTLVYGQFVNGPLAVMSGAYGPTCALQGDSNTIGLTVGRDRAFGAQACIAAGIGFVQLGQSIEKAQSFASVAGRHNRILLTRLCFTALCNYGTNDIIQGRTSANLQTDNLAICNADKGAGVLKVFQCTVIPMASSTNGHVDLVNQSPHANDAVRQDYNTYLRSGYPLDPLTFEPTTIGAPGAVTCDVYNASKVKVLTGTGPHPCSGVVEIADTVESSRNSGKWKTSGVVADQFHPGDAGHTLMAAAVPTELFV